MNIWVAVSFLTSLTGYLIIGLASFSGGIEFESRHGRLS